MERAGFVLHNVVCRGYTTCEQLQAMHNTAVAERTRLYRRAQEIVHADAPWVPLVHATQTAAFRRGVEGFELHPTGSKWFRSVTLRR